MKNFITAEEFLKLPKEVQNEIVSWWKPSIGDLFAWNEEANSQYMHEVNCCSSVNIVDITTKNKGIELGDRIPLLQIHHLIEFLEDKTGYVVDISFCGGYEIKLFGHRGLMRFCPYDLNVLLVDALLFSILEIVFGICRED